MYPLKFENIYFNKLWGGDEFKLFRKNLPPGKIGESWDLSCHPKAISVISNGLYKGKKLNEIIEIFGDAILGSELKGYTFPLLIKLINAEENLSIQVHPDDEYARIHEKDGGKNEAWYVMKACPGASVVLGTKNCTKDKFKEMLESGGIEKYLNILPVKSGDVFHVKSGLIHGIGKGLIIAEIQQNSDITYRAYDYNRGRELHIEKVMGAADFSLTGDKITGKTKSFNGFEIIEYIHSVFFDIKICNIYIKMMGSSSSKRFYTYTCLEGAGTINYKRGSMNIKMGESILIPAALGKYEIIGKLKLLKAVTLN